MIKLGSKVRDKYTGFTGTAISRTEWLYGCARIAIEPTELHEGKPIEAHYFDEQRVELVEEQAPVIAKESTATTGGDRPAPRRSADPKR